MSIESYIDTWIFHQWSIMQRSQISTLLLGAERKGLQDPSIDETVCPCIAY